MLCNVLAKGFCNLAATNMLYDIPETCVQWHQTQYGSSYSMLDVYGDTIWKVVLLNIPFVSDTLTKTLVKQVNNGLRLSKPIEKFQTCTEPGCPTKSYITIFEGLIDYCELSNKLESAVYALVDIILISLRGGEKVLGCRFGLEQPICSDGVSRSAWDVFEITAVNLTDYYEFILCLTTIDHPCRWNEVMSIQVSLKSSVPSTLRIRCRANSIWCSLSNVVMLLKDLVDQINVLEMNNIQAQAVKQFLRVCLEIFSRVRHRPRAV